MGYQYILIDADDTLFDYVKAEEYALSSALNDQAIICNDKIMTTYRSINQRLWEEFELGNIELKALRTERFKRLFQTENLSINSNVEEFSDRYLQHLGQSAFLLEGAIEICSFIVNQGLKLVMITNGIKEVQMSRIKGSELADIFDEIIVSEDTGFQKPHPGIFDYTFKKLRVEDKSQFIMVGDSLTSDIQGGLNYGIDTCWFNPRHKPNQTNIKPTYEIHSLGELTEIISGGKL